VDSFIISLLLLCEELLSSALSFYLENELFEDPGYQCLLNHQVVKLNYHWKDAHSHLFCQQLKMPILTQKLDEYSSHFRSHAQLTFFAL
jgi:hypothetical protein